MNKYRCTKQVDKGVLTIEIAPMPPSRMTGHSSNCRIQLVICVQVLVKQTGYRQTTVCDRIFISTYHMCKRHQVCRATEAH